MPSPEHPGGGQHEEHEPVPYFRVSRSTDAPFNHTCDLSTYRLLLESIAQVAVLGTSPPPQELDEHVKGALGFRQGLCVKGERQRASRNKLLGGG
jgi:hypothetical protein